MKAKGFYIVALLAALFIASANDLFAEEHPQKTNKVEVKENRVSVDVEDADIPDVLKEIEKGTGVKTTVGQGLMGKKISAKFENLDIEDSLREILKNNYYVLTYVQDANKPDKKVLKEIKADGDIIGKVPLKGELISFVIPYGSGKGEIGIHEGGEGDSSGPSCYAVDEKGDIYIPDAINEKVLRYTAKGVQLPSIPVENAGCDIIVDDKGFIYIHLSGRKKLYQYNKSGALIKEIEVNTEHLQSAEGSVYYANNKIYLSSCTHGEKCGQFLIGNISADNVLNQPTEVESKIVHDKYWFQSGKKYKGKKHVQGYNNELYIEYKNSDVYRTISTPSGNKLTRDLFGEDSHGNFYFQRRTVENVDRLYDIDKYSPDGEYVGTAQIPGGSPAFGVFKGGFLVSGKGNIYEFLPEAASLGLKLYVFIGQGN